MGSHARLPRPLLHQNPPLLHTPGALRTTRAEWRRLQAAIAHGDQQPVPADPQDDDTTLVLAHWAFDGTGLTRGEEWLAASLAPDTTEGLTP